jgi:peroxiredoxin
MSRRVSAGAGTAARGLRCARAGRVLVLELLVLSVVAAALAGCRWGGALVGKPAPDFSLTDLAGRTVRLANLRGRIVFVNVWASWCEPCRQEMPAMQVLYQRLAGPDFEMLAVNADQGPSEEVTRFVETMGLTFPVLRDPDLLIAQRYQVTGYPETFVIDRNGTVVEHAIGPYAWDSPKSLAAFRRLITSGEWVGL